MLKTRIISPADHAYSYPLLIKNLLLSGSRYEPDHEIVYRDRVRFNYVTFNQRIARLANVLSDAGVKAGDTVAIMDWDSHRYLECMFAVPMIGAVLHTINVRLSPDQILFTMKHADDRFVLVNSEFAALYKGISDQLDCVEKTILLTDEPADGLTLPGLIGEYEALLAQVSDQYEFADFDEQSVATTFYTTGTTGDPKGVYFTHRQLVLHTLAVTSAINSMADGRFMGSDDVYMPITPMFHVHAWGVPYAATMLGLKQVYPGRYDAAMLIELQQREKVTFSHCVPTILQMILDAPGSEEFSFEGWKMVIGGSALNHGLYDRATQRGFRLIAGYGMSETCPIISWSHFNAELMDASAEQRAEQSLKAGVPIPLVQARIIDEQGNFMPVDDPNAQGELVVRSPWLTGGYIKEPEKSEALWASGWLHTGDVVTFDRFGSIDIRDRIKDVIKTGGEWISSLELEDLISRHPAVREAAVVGMPDERWGERPFALIVTHDGKPLDADMLKRHMEPFVLQGHINKWAIPSQVITVDDIPKTSVGKLDKKRVRAQLAEWNEALANQA